MDIFAELGFRQFGASEQIDSFSAIGFQMKHDMAIEEDARLVQTVKSDLVAGLAQRTAARLKLKLGLY